MVIVDSHDCPEAKWQEEKREMVKRANRINLMTRAVAGIGMSDNHLK
jgi:hypothetical protein